MRPRGVDLARLTVTMIALVAACTWDDYDDQDTLGIRGDLVGKPLPGAFRGSDSAGVSDERIVGLMGMLSHGT